MSNWEDVAFLTNLAFLCSAPSNSRAKLEEEGVVMYGSASLSPWHVNCCEYDSGVPSTQYEAICHR